MMSQWIRWVKREDASPTKLTYLVAFVAGGLLPLAFAPVNFYPLAFLLPALLFYLWRGTTARQAAKIGFFFGLGEFAIGISWIYVAIHEFGLSSVAVASLLTTLFVAFLALYIAAQGYLSQSLVIRYGKSDTSNYLLIYPACWVFMEWFRGWFLTGFPWLNLGYSQVDTLLVGYAPILGVYGISWLVVLISGLLLLFTKNLRANFILSGSIVVIFIAGLLLNKTEWTDIKDEPLKVALIQGNMPQHTKWDADSVAERVEQYAGLTRKRWNNDLVIWPENSMTAFHHQLDEKFLQPFSEEAKATNTELIIGIPFLDQDTYQYYSSFLTIGEHPAFYHKTHLVPFGEYLPLNFLLRDLINFFSMPMSDFSRGDWMQPLLQVKGQKVAATICYEDAFGEELIRYLPEATLLVNGSNNAWYGDSFAPHQHLQISRMRAVETGRDLMRATTNGISALINQKGEIVSRSKQFEADVVTGSVQPRSGATWYVLWGNYPVLISLLLCFISIVVLNKSIKR